MTDREKLIEILRKPIFPHELVDPTEAVADYLLDNGVTVQQWISVEDEVPVGDCIVYDANSGKVRVGSGTEILAAADWRVTHWMELPEPPKED